MGSCAELDSSPPVYRLCHILRGFGYHLLPLFDSVPANCNFLYGPLNPQTHSNEDKITEEGNDSGETGSKLGTDLIGVKVRENNYHCC